MQPSLSIVIGARADEGDVAGCLAALAGQLDDGVEVIVAADGPGGRLPASVTVVEKTGGLVPGLWAEGIRHSSGRLIGLLAATALPCPDWVELTRAAHAGATAIVGGTIEPGVPLSPVDWAVYFCRYAPYMAPLSDATGLEVPGDNASYDGEVLRRYSAVYQDGFWEPSVHAAMRADGHAQSFCERRTVRVGPGVNASQFRRRRVAHGREHGRRRAAGVPPWRSVLGIVTAPMVPLVMTGRAARTVFRKRRFRGRFVLAAPLVLWFYAWWAVGEMHGRLDAVRRGPR